MDEASEMQMLADVNAVPQAAGDERFMKEFAKKGKRVNDPKNLWDDVKEGASGLYDKAKGLFQKLAKITLFLFFSILIHPKNLNLGTSEILSATWTYLQT